jgi:DNA-binding response OmpR family regulator
MGFDADSAVSPRAMRPGEILVFDLSLVEVLDGAAYRQVQSTRPIVLTGATDPSSRALASALDASDYLVKPVELEDLAAAINRRMAEA